MASSVKFGRFKADKAGYRQVKNSAQVQGMLKVRAEAVKRAADAALKADGYRLEGHVVKHVELPRAGDRAYMVRTKTDHARRSQGKHKTLTKALGAAKG